MQKKAVNANLNAFFLQEHIKTSKSCQQSLVSQLMTWRPNVRRKFSCTGTVSLHTTPPTSCASPLFLTMSVLNFCASAGCPTIFTVTYGSTTSLSKSWFAFGMCCPLIIVNLSCAEGLKSEKLLSEWLDRWVTKNGQCGKKEWKEIKDTKQQRTDSEFSNLCHSVAPRLSGNTWRVHWFNHWLNTWLPDWLDL